MNTSMDRFITSRMNFTDRDSYIRQVRNVFRADRGVEIVQEWPDNFCAITGQ